MNNAVYVIALGKQFFRIKNISVHRMSYFVFTIETNDIIIALLVSYFSKIEIDFPNFLDGFCLKIEPDNLTLFIENQKPIVMAL